MAIPEQTFANLPALVDYSNVKIVPNDRREIDGAEVNNVVNGLAYFIPAYTMNAVDGADIVSTGGAVALDKPISIITGTLPTSVTWSANVQKELYISNTFGVELPLSGVTYYDFLMVERTTIPLLSTIHIAQAINGSWVQVNNLGGEASDVPNSKTDTESIAVHLSGTLNRDIEVELLVSEGEGNVLEIRSDGAFVPAPAAPPSSAVTGDL